MTLRHNGPNGPATSNTPSTQNNPLESAPISHPLHGVSETRRSLAYGPSQPAYVMLDQQPGQGTGDYLGAPIGNPPSAVTNPPASPNTNNAEFDAALGRINPPAPGSNPVNSRFVNEGADVTNIPAQLQTDILTLLATVRTSSGRGRQGDAALQALLTLWTNPGTNQAQLTLSERMRALVLNGTNGANAAPGLRAMLQDNAELRTNLSSKAPQGAPGTAIRGELFETGAARLERLIARIDDPEALRDVPAIARNYAIQDFRKEADAHALSMLSLVASERTRRQSLPQELREVSQRNEDALLARTASLGIKNSNLELIENTLATATTSQRLELLQARPELANLLARRAHEIFSRTSAGVMGADTPEAIAHRNEGLNRIYDLVFTLDQSNVTATAARERFVNAIATDADRSPGLAASLLARAPSDLRARLLSDRPELIAQVVNGAEALFTRPMTHPADRMDAMRNMSIMMMGLDPRNESVRNARANLATTIERIARADTATGTGDIANNVTPLVGWLRNGQQGSACPMPDVPSRYGAIPLNGQRIWNDSSGANMLPPLAGPQPFAPMPGSMVGTVVPGGAPWQIGGNIPGIGVPTTGALPSPANTSQDEFRLLSTLQVPIAGHANPYTDAEAVGSIIRNSNSPHLAAHDAEVRRFVHGAFNRDQNLAVQVLRSAATAEGASIPAYITSLAANRLAISSALDQPAVQAMGAYSVRRLNAGLRNEQEATDIQNIAGRLWSEMYRHPSPPSQARTSPRIFLPPQPPSGGADVPGFPPRQPVLWGPSSVTSQIASLLPEERRRSVVTVTGNQAAVLQSAAVSLGDILGAINHNAGTLRTGPGQSLITIPTNIGWATGVPTQSGGRFRATAPFIHPQLSEVLGDRVRGVSVEPPPNNPSPNGPPVGPGPGPALPPTSPNQTEDPSYNQPPGRGRTQGPTQSEDRLAGIRLLNNMGINVSPVEAHQISRVLHGPSGPLSNPRRFWNVNDSESIA